VSAATTMTITWSVMGGVLCRPGVEGKNSKPRIPLRLRSGSAQEDGAPSVHVERASVGVRVGCPACGGGLSFWCALGAVEKGNRDHFAKKPTEEVGFFNYRMSAGGGISQQAPRLVPII
jgi:hypothetical protein